MRLSWHLQNLALDCEFKATWRSRQKRCTTLCLAASWQRRINTPGFLLQYYMRLCSMNWLGALSPSRKLWDCSPSLNEASVGKLLGIAMCHKVLGLPWFFFPSCLDPLLCIHHCVPYPATLTILGRESLRKRRAGRFSRPLSRRKGGCKTGRLVVPACFAGRVSPK